MLLKRTSLNLTYVLAAVVILFAAVTLQTMEILQLGFVGFIVLAWLISSLILGFSLRNTLLFCALFFIKPLPTSYLVILLILPVSLLFEYLQSGRKSLSIPYPLALLVLMGASAFGLLRSPDMSDAYLYFLSTLVVPAIMFIVIANSRITRADFLTWMRVLVGIGALLGVIGVFMAVLNPSERFGSLWVTAMTINGFYTLSFFFAIALGIREGTSGKRYIWYLAALLIFLGMMYTYTRMALVAVAFGFFLLMWRMKKLRYVGMVALLLLPLVIPSSMTSRLRMSFTLDLSLLIRLVAWYFSVQQISQHPLFGIGISTWKTWYAGAVPLDKLYAEHPHNLYLKIWLEIGIFGFLSYFYLIISPLRRYYLKLVKPSSGNVERIVLIGMFALLFACLTDIFIQQYQISLVFWATLAMMYALARNDNQLELT